jgi:hypothetical protein
MLLLERCKMERKEAAVGGSRKLMTRVRRVILTVGVQLPGTKARGVWGLGSSH